MEDADSGVSAARQLHKIREEYQIKLGNIENRVRKQCEDNLKKRTGELYQEIEEEITQRLLKEHRVREINLEEMRETFEQQEIEAVQHKVADLEREFEKQYIAATQEFTDKLAQSRARWDEARAARLQEQTSGHLEKLREQEDEFLRKQQTQVADFDQEREQLARQVSTTMDQAVSHVDKALEERRREDLELMKSRVTALETLYMKIQSALKDDGSRQQYDFMKALKRLQELDTRARTSLLKGYDSDLAVMQSATVAERAMRTEATKMMETAHSKQLQVLQQMADEQNRDTDLMLEALEDSLGAKYETVYRRLQDQVRNEQDMQVTRAVEALARRARMEAELSRQAIDEQQRAEDAAATKFQSMLGDLRKLWEEEEAIRFKDQEQRLKAQYEQMISNMRAQVEMALQLHEFNDWQWMQDMSNRFKTQMETVERFKHKCQRLYSQRLTDFANITQQQFAQYEARLLESSEAAVSARHQLEVAMRRMKQGCAKWRYDYQRYTQTQMQQSMALLETRYMDEIESSLTELSEAREALAEREFEKSKALRKLRDEVLAKQERAKVAREEDAKKVKGKADVARTLSSLYSLWTETATPADQQAAELKELFRLAGYTPELLSHLRKCHAHVAAKRPLLRICAHYEKLTRRLDNVKASAGVGDDPASTPSNKQWKQQQRRKFAGKGASSAVKGIQNDAAFNTVASVGAELHIFSMHLGRLLEDFEDTHEAEFWYNSERLLAVLRQEYRESCVRTGHPPATSMKDAQIGSHLDPEWESVFAEVGRWLRIAQERKAGS